MKRILSLLLCFALIMTAAPAVMAEGEVKIIIDGTPLQASDANGKAVYPIILNGTTYLPVRAVGQAFGRAVSWDGATNTVYIGEPLGTPVYTETVKISIDGRILDPRDANGNPAPPFIESGTTYLPVRAVGEAFGRTVQWDAEANAVLLTRGPSDKADTSASSDEIDGKFFRVVQQGVNLPLTVEDGSVQNGAKIVVNASVTGNADQWEFDSLGDGYYAVINRASGKSLDIPSSNKDAGTGVTQYDSNGGGNQTVKVIKNADGTYSFQFRHSGLYLTAGSRYVTQENPDGSDGQRFTLQFVEDGIMNKVPNSPGFFALGDKAERLRAYLYSDISFSRNVKAQAAAKLQAADYLNLGVDAQRALLEECMHLTAYNQVWINNIPNESNATYEITAIDYDPSYDVWRGTMKPVWIHHVRMTGDVPGQVHEFIMVSTDQNSSMIKDSLNAISRFPYAMRKYITRMVYRDDEANSFNADYANVYMRIQGTRDEETIAVLLAHELGHTLDQNCAGDSTIWDRAIEADGVSVSGYGNTNRTEDLAEYSRLYHSVKKDPEKLAIIEQIYPNRSREYQAMLYKSDSVYYSGYKNSFFESSGIQAAGVTAKPIKSGGLFLTVTDSNSGSGVKVSPTANGLNSQWRLYPTNDGYYVAFNEASGLCLNVPGNSADNGKGIIQWNGGNGDNEKMTKIDNGNGTFKLRFKHSGLYLAVSGSDAVQSSSGSDWTY